MSQLVNRNIEYAKVDVVDRKKGKVAVLSTPKTSLDMAMLLRRLVSGTIDDLGLWKIERLMDHKNNLTQRLLNLMKQLAPDSLMLQGYQLYYGYGVGKDDHEAMLKFKQGADTCDPYGYFHYMVGRCYMYGRGVEQSVDLAVQSYTEGVNRGCGFAAFRLGVCCDQATGVEQSYARALAYFTYAHLQGHPGSTYWLATLYHFGQGVPKNLRGAVSLYKQALEVDETHCLSQLKLIQGETPDLLVPYDEWSPMRCVQMWVPAATRTEMLTLLMCKLRPSPLHSLPHGVLLHICYFLSCRPTGRVRVSPELYASGNSIAMSWRATIESRQAEQRNTARFDQLQRQLSVMQEMLGSLLNTSAQQLQLKQGAEQDQAEDSTGKRAKRC